ncbi:IS1595 family transposase ISCco3 [Apilactobacillus kunkeei]|nr:IS1595 family transposase ISCco3 [Apilactobacillus kunkeei]
MSNKKYTYVDLFCGAGGMSLGFDQAGFKNIFSVEYDTQIANTYSKNFPSHNLYVGDIKELSEKEINRYLNSQKVDVVVGGPPCQGFSMAGNNGRTFVNDPRNYLFKEFVRVVSVIEPSIFVMENVSRLSIHNGGSTLKEIFKTFESIGYNVKSKVLQAADYGVPQRRQRIFVVGTKKINNFEYPEKSKTIKTVKDAIDDLPSLVSGEKSNIPNHVAMNHSQQMLKKMSYIKDGGNRYSIPENIRPKTGDSRKYIKYNSSKPAYTVTGDNRKIFHYNQNRALTARELARLQTFPDDFVFFGTSGSIQQQIGNAVPPKLAMKIANSVYSYLERG